VGCTSEVSHSTPVKLSTNPPSRFQDSETIQKILTILRLDKEFLFVLFVRIWQMEGANVRGGPRLQRG